MPVQVRVAVCTRRIAFDMWAFEHEEEAAYLNEVEARHGEVLDDLYEQYGEDLWETMELVERPDDVIANEYDMETYAALDRKRKLFGANLMVSILDGLGYKTPEALTKYIENDGLPGKER